MARRPHHFTSQTPAIRRLDFVIAALGPVIESAGFIRVAAGPVWSSTDAESMRVVDSRRTQYWRRMSGHFRIGLGAHLRAVHRVLGRDEAPGAIGASWCNNSHELGSLAQRHHGGWTL